MFSKISIEKGKYTLGLISTAAKSLGLPFIRKAILTRVGIQPGRQ